MSYSLFLSNDSVFVQILSIFERHCFLVESRMYWCLSILRGYVPFGNSRYSYIYCYQRGHNHGELRGTSTFGFLLKSSAFQILTEFEQKHCHLKGTDYKTPVRLKCRNILECFFHWSKFVIQTMIMTSIRRLYVCILHLVFKCSCICNKFV